VNDDKHVAPLGDPHDSEPVSQATIDSWRINYGLDKRNPSQAAQWWCEHAHGMAPAGAVAALGIALDALEAAQKDAERYRWLVAHGGVGFEGAPGWGTVVRFDTADSAANTLTAAIDAAMKDAP
jgi:hypothetical protein